LWDGSGFGFQRDGTASGYFRRLARLAAIVMTHPGLRIEVEGNSDTSAGEEMSFNARRGPPCAGRAWISG